MAQVKGNKGKGNSIGGAGWCRNGDGPGAGPSGGRARSGPLFRPKNAGRDDA
ncbi:hypothetical protein [Pseudarthrobacter polychromogenes]|uniref:Uncharacterized protein n=1 Tax=Pseudarthrobacter polychromogenes TaxID=1676 RepID=A0ABQ1XHI2_9MICC|nr:hypothetical protein [Pseudarthrobacter polychromogenes]GGG93636.1 hypothetical protein GCM10011577_15610 [Pseudarthrobacter polychromogenes]